MKIVFCGGGTAGHVTPNIALINKLDGELYYIGSDGIEKKLIAPLAESGKIKGYFEISAHKLQRKLTLKNLALPFQLLKSVKEAKRHLKEIAPDVVFSKGGFVGLPVIIAARQLKIPSIIHESDLTPGLANKICAKFATVFLSAFPCHKRAKVVGAIVREEILHGNREIGLKTMGFDGKKPVLLVTGGSLGAAALNEAVSKNENLAKDFDIFVVTGKGKSFNCDFVSQKEYVDNMPDVMAAANVCLTRAGSNSLAELTLAQVPFVTVPLTKCSRGEQGKNAAWFCEKGAGIKLDEENLDAKLENAVKTVYNNRSAFTNKQKRLSYLFGTDKTIADIKKYDKNITREK